MKPDYIDLDAFGKIWGNIFIHLLAIGVFCAIVLTIWKGLCWLDSWRWCKKRYPKANTDSRYIFLKEFTETMAILNQSIKKQDDKTVAIWKKYLEIKGNLLVIKEQILQCLEDDIKKNGIKDKLFEDIHTCFDDIDSQFPDLFSKGSKDIASQIKEIKKLCGEIKEKVEKLSNLHNNNIIKIIKRWHLGVKINKQMKELGTLIENFNKCIKYCHKTNDNGQTQQ